MPKSGPMKIAIVGMSFRFPGGGDREDKFWEILKDGKDVISTIGEERWATDIYGHPVRSEPGASVTWSAGLLDQIDEFDASFFGITPREADQMDPQQRILLELCWEAFENGGQIPSELAGSDCAVYLGISSLDYGIRALDDLSGIGAYSMTGNTLSIAANRISYVFDLHGPSIAMDTACSSSLVALHQACKSLREGESSTAIAAGMHLLLHPHPFIGFTKASMLSSRGKCRAFDASGDGYVRSEGGAVLFLKPLEQALADGDPIHAVIRDSAVNSDGADKTGITIPSAAGQIDLMRSVVTRTGLESDGIDYIEAHGTGTSVGDPIETAAIGEVYGKNRSQPMYIGSVKTNVGHLEPASGLAGVIKTVLSLKNRALPPSLNLETPNPHIDFKGLNIKPVTEYVPLPDCDRPLRMGVNSFGFGGANAHVLLEEFISAPKPETKVNPTVVPPLFLSAKTPGALKELAGKYVDLLNIGSDLPLTTIKQDKKTPSRLNHNYYDVAYTAATHRQRLDLQLAAWGNTEKEIITSLQQYANGEYPDGIVVEDSLQGAAPISFVYSGNGSQWIGMGQKLLKDDPSFSDTIEEIEALLGDRADFSLRDELVAESDSSKMHLTEVAQPTLFAVQVGITKILRRHGVNATHAIGHSVGEIAAAWAMGCLSLEQAVDVIYERSSAQGTTKGYGRMAAVGLSAKNIELELADANLADSIEIAGINSPGNVTISGSFEDLESLRKRLELNGVFYRLLDLDYAFHSRLMDPIQKIIIDDLSDLSPSNGHGVFISTVTGAVFDGAKLDATYWWDNIRKPVQFENAVNTLIEEACRVFVEIGPHSVLQRYVSECLSTQKVDGRSIPTLKKDDGGLIRIQEAAYRSCLLSDSLALDEFFPQQGRYLSLPNYPWQRERYWGSVTSEGYNLINRQSVHPLLGYRLKDGVAAWENQLDTHRVPYLADHVIAGSVVLPGTAYIEMALAASVEWYGGDNHEIEELEILAPIVFDGESAQTVRFEISQDDGRFRITARRRLSDDTWNLHAVGRLIGVPFMAQPAPQSLSSTSSLNSDGNKVSNAEHYRLAKMLGLEFGPAFQSMAEAWPDDYEITARIEPCESVQLSTSTHVLHPAMLDACFQTLIGIFKEKIEGGNRSTLLPVHVGRLRLYGTGQGPAWCNTRIVKRSPHSVLADFQLFDNTGNTLAVLEACRFREIQLTRNEKLTAARWQNILTAKPRLTPTDQAPIPQLTELLNVAETLLLESEPTLKRASHFQQVTPLFDALIASFAYEAFQTIVRSHDDSLDNLLSGLFSNSRTGAYTTWISQILEDDGYLVQEENGWQFTEEEPPPANIIWLTILGDYPNYLPDLVLVGSVGLHLVSILDGSMDPDDFVTALNNGNTKKQLSETSPFYVGIDLAAGEIIKNIADSWPQNRRLRILELPGEERSFTQHIIDLMPADRCDYFIGGYGDEISAFYELEFTGHPFVSVVALDKDTLSFEEDEVQQFDIVIANHELHRTDEPTQALMKIATMLSPSGLFLLMERHPDRCFDFVNGLSKSWWEQANQGGVYSRLLNPSDWSDLLNKAGYLDTEILLEPSSTEEAIGPYSLLAKRPDSSGTETGAVDPATWLIIADNQGDSLKLAALLEGRLLPDGHRVMTAIPGGAQPTDGTNVIEADLESIDGIASLMTQVNKELGGCNNIILLRGLSFGPDIDSSPMPVQESRCITTLHLVHALERVEASTQPKLWLITAGAAIAEQMHYSEPLNMINPAQAPLWGFGRVLMNEYPDLKCSLIDLQQNVLDDILADRLAVDLVEPDGEDEIILSEHGRHVLRMQPILEKPQESIDNGQQTISLTFDAPGQLNNLKWSLVSEKSLATDEIEIQPKAVGLNFRDVMYTMGMLSDEAVENGFSGPTLGLELAGVVTKVGNDVTDFAAGDAVIAFAPACFSTRVVTKVASAYRKPEGWSFEEAATIPAVFFTVYYALHYLARLQPGEKILIHGAAGGVGIAAIQLARHLGAEVYATAGSKEKQDFVRMLGADHVMNSRDLAFADDIITITDGAGIDVVLNSLAGEAINRNLRVLRPFGRFLELGKRDFYENTRIGLRPFKDNITYFGIDADQLMVERPVLATQLFRELMQLFEDGVLRPLPYRAFSAAKIIDAFRYMQQAKQIGKIIVNLENIPSIFNESNREIDTPVLYKDSTYIVTGGVGGFGLESAYRLAEWGAGNLVLLSRSGMDSPGAATAIEQLEALGCKVQITACDITDRDQLGRVFSNIQRNLPPVKGVIHAAMVLDDGLIQNLDQDRFLKPMYPKIDGAWNLHNLTKDLPLDFFVLYSSATTFIGNPGQANYVAANMYLEALAAYRRLHGMPATSVSWGAIADVGFLARNDTVMDSLQSRLGGKALQSVNALNQLGEMIATNENGQAIIDFNWLSLERFLPSSSAKRYEILKRTADRSAAETESTIDIHSLIENRSHEEQIEILSEIIKNEVVQIMRMPKDRIDVNRSLYDLGMDSLMGVELAVALEQRTGITLPMMALSASPTIHRVAELFVQRLHSSGDNEAEEGTEMGDLISKMASQHGIEASEEEMKSAKEAVLKAASGEVKEL